MRQYKEEFEKQNLVFWEGAYPMRERNSEEDTSPFPEDRTYQGEEKIRTPVEMPKGLERRVISDKEL